MQDEWTYERKKRFDKHRVRWHFVNRYIDEAREIYFRDDAETTFGMLRFDRPQDNTYRDFDTIANKIMNTVPFRNSLLDPSTQSIWKKKWR